MENLPYKVIKSTTQYKKYCHQLEALVAVSPKTKLIKDEIELLSLLIEKYDEQNNSFLDEDPIQLLKYLMKEHKMKSITLATLLSVSEGLVSDILKYKKGLSKEVIRKLSIHFKVSQEAFNRPYALKSVSYATTAHKANTNSTKEMSMA